MWKLLYFNIIVYPKAGSVFNGEFLLDAVVQLHWKNTRKCVTKIRNNSNDYDNQLANRKAELEKGTILIYPRYH